MKKLLLLLIACLVFGCSVDSTIATDAQDIGSVQQPFLRRAFDDVTPADTVYDFNNSTQLNEEGWVGPWLVGISGWVTTPDASAGALIFNMSYTDPTGSTRFVNFGGSDPVLLLNDGSSFFATQGVWMVRESGFSPWDLNVALAGDAGDSLVHYEVMVGPNYQDDWQFFSDQP